MKKMIAMGIITILALGLTGCTEATEPTVTEPEVTTPEPTPVETVKITDPLGTDYSGATNSFILEDGSLLSHEDLAVELGENERIEFAAVVDPKNKKVIYFFTYETESINDWKAIAHRLYSYNTETKELTEVFKTEDYTTESMDILGIEGSKLIVAIMGVDNSPGPGWSPWLGEGNLHALDLEDLDSAFVKYTVPQYKVDEEEAKIEEFMKEMEAL